MPKDKEERKEPNIRLHRNAKGELRPVPGVSPNLAIEVEVLPLTYGASRRLKSFGEALFDWSDEDRITVINEHLIWPKLNILDEDDLQDNFDGWVIEDLLQAIFLYSGMARLYEDPDIEGNVPSEDNKEEDDSQ